MELRLDTRLSEMPLVDYDGDAFIYQGEVYLTILLSNPSVNGYMQAFNAQRHMIALLPSDAKITHVDSKIHIGVYS